MSRNNDVSNLSTLSDPRTVGVTHKKNLTYLVCCDCVLTRCPGRNPAVFRVFVVRFLLQRLMSLVVGI